MVEGKGQEPATTAQASERCFAGPGRIICFGGAAVDRKYMALDRIRAGTSNPCAGSSSFGGVARNVAANLARLGVETSLVSIVGGDTNGRSLVQDLLDLGIDAEGVRVAAGERTAEYVAVLDPDRSLAVGMADMAVLDRLGMDDLVAARSRLGTADWIFADGNLSAAVLGELVRGPSAGPAKLAVDVVSTPKAERLPRDLQGVDLLFLNLEEAAAVLRVSVAALSPETAVRHLQDRGAREIVLTRGAGGLVLCDASSEISRVAAVPARVVDVTGAGDALIAATLAWRLEGATLVASARMGTLAAALTIEQEGSTHPGLDRDLLAKAAGELPQAAAAPRVKVTR
jgi:pseudouridine kinase